MTCLSSRSAVAANATPPSSDEAEWTLQFSDDFNRASLNKGEIDLKPSDWRVLSGNWSLEDGWLHGEGDALILPLLRFPGDQRLVFDAVAGDDAGDLSGLLATDERSGVNFGYFFGFGSSHNTLSRLLVDGRQVTRYPVTITPGKIHRVVCQREGGRLTHIIDGRVVATYDDPQPLTGPRRDGVGLYIFGKGKIDNIRVYTKGDDASPPQRFDTRDPSQDRNQIGDYLIPDPLFDELMSDTPAPDVFFSYGGKYLARPEVSTGANDLRQTAKRFGFRYVHEELLDEAAANKIVVYGRMDDPAFAEHGIATHSRWVEPPPGQGYLYLPDQTLPPVFGTEGWIMDPRYQEQLVREIQQRAREHRYWGIAMFDELWSHYVFKPVPRDRWYPQVVEADRQIREHYGYGKFGMPESAESDEPFHRIAYRRWASDQLTRTFEKAYQAAKAIHPEMKIIGPTEGSSGASADIEAWAPYFDIMGGQCGLGGTSAAFDNFRVGAVTKMYVDMTAKPIWMMVHLCVGQAPRRTPEDVRELYSQVFRNGGQGLWLMHSEFNEAELEDAMYAEPARWRAMLQLTQAIGRMRLPKLPEPDVAILWSSDSMNTTRYGQFWGGDNDRVVNAYTILGPMLRSWFHFASDRQLDRGERDLNDYKVVYLPFAPYQRSSVLKSIEDYVARGGIVVCTDSDAFSWGLDGEPLDTQWEALSGVRRVSRREHISDSLIAASNDLSLQPALSIASLLPGWNLMPLNDNVQTLAVFEDGSPAITRHAYGKGSVIVFAADPLHTSDFFRIPEPLYSLSPPLDKESLVTSDSGIVTFVKAIQASAGVEMGRDIWRFKLPPFAEDPYQKEKGLCLTNNYIFDVNEPLLEPNNLQTDGTYSYNRAPTGIPDQRAAGESIAFREGKLTNRLAAFESRQRYGSRDRNFETITPQWIVSWTDRAPITITFDLKSVQALEKCRLVYFGTMPALIVSGSDDGTVWRKLSSTQEQIAGTDVKDATLSLVGDYRYVRLGLSRRQTGDVFELCEVEFWGPSAD